MENEKNQDGIHEENSSNEKKRIPKYRREEKARAKFDPNSMPLSPSSGDDETYDEPPKGRFGGRSDLLMQIGIALLVSIVVVFVMTNFLGMGVSKSAYQKDITRLENDLVTVRGAGYQSGKGEDLATLAISLSSMNSRLGTFLVQGNLDTYATKSEVTSQINAVKTGIPNVDTLTSQVNTKLAQVDAKLATLGNGTLVSKTDFDAAVIMLLAKIAQIGKSVNYSFIGSGDTYAMLVGPNSKDSYSGKIDFTYATGTATNLGTTYTAAVASFYALTAGQYTPTIVQGTDLNWYLTGASVQVQAFDLTTDGAIQYIPLKGLYSFGTPTKVVVNLKA